VGLIYMGIFLAFALTVARIRAEVASPRLAVSLRNAEDDGCRIAGTAPLSPAATRRPSPRWRRWHSCSSPTPFPSPDIRWRVCGWTFRRREAATHLRCADRPFLIGLLLSFYLHIATFYQVGANVQSGVYGLGFYGSSGAISEYTRAIENAASPLRQTSRRCGGLSGFGTVFCCSSCAPGSSASRFTRSVLLPPTLTDIFSGGHSSLCGLSK